MVQRYFWVRLNRLNLKIPCRSLILTNPMQHKRTNVTSAAVWAGLTVALTARLTSKAQTRPQTNINTAFNTPVHTMKFRKRAPTHGQLRLAEYELDWRKSAARACGDHMWPRILRNKSPELSPDKYDGESDIGSKPTLDFHLEPRSAAIETVLETLPNLSSAHNKYMLSQFYFQKAHPNRPIQTLSGIKRQLCNAPRMTFAFDGFRFRNGIRGYLGRDKWRFNNTLKNKHHVSIGAVVKKFETSEYQILPLYRIRINLSSLSLRSNGRNGYYTWTVPDKWIIMWSSYSWAI